MSFALEVFEEAGGFIGAESGTTLNESFKDAWRNHWEEGEKPTVTKLSAKKAFTRGWKRAKKAAKTGVWENPARIAWSRISSTEWQAEVDGQYVGSIDKRGALYIVFGRTGKVVKRARTLAAAKRGVTVQAA